MRNNKIIYVLIFLLIFISLALIIMLNLNYINNLTEKEIKKYGYPAVFVLSFLSDIVDQPIGPETIGGAAVLFGLNSLVVFILAVSGSWCVNLASFYVSRKYMSDKIIASCSTKEYHNYCRFFSKYSRLALLFSGLFFPYIIMIWIAGAFQMKLRDFFIFGMLARALRIGLVILAIVGVLKIGI